MDSHKMKNKQLRFRMSERRYNKLQLYAVQVDKTMTQLFEEFVDSLPIPEIDVHCRSRSVPKERQNSTTLQPVLPAVKND